MIFAGMKVHAYNLSTQNAEAERLPRVQGHIGLYCEFLASLGCETLTNNGSKCRSFSAQYFTPGVSFQVCCQQRFQYCTSNTEC